MNPFSLQVFVYHPTHSWDTLWDVYLFRCACFFRGQEGFKKEQI
jgi:hypothetical protein